MFVSFFTALSLITSRSGKLFDLVSFYTTGRSSGNAFFFADGLLMLLFITSFCLDAFASLFAATTFAGSIAFLSTGAGVIVFISLTVLFLAVPCTSLLLF